MSHAYQLATLKLASAVELPGLAPWDGPPETPDELVFRLGAVPLCLELPDHVSPLFQTRGPEAFLIDVPEAGRFLVQNGREITVEPEPGTDLSDIAASLTGPLQAVLWHQRGLLPLHAVAMVGDGRAIALAGPSGCGKSTIAAILSREGWRILADDICVTRLDNEEVSVLPGFPRLRLWRDALDHLGMTADGLSRVLSDKEKFLVEPLNGSASDPSPLAAVVLPVRRPGEVAIRRLRGLAAVVALDANVHMRGPARALGCDVAIFAALTRLVACGIGVWRLEVPDDPAALSVAAALIGELEFSS